MDTCDVAVVGAGHHGLVCATYLARAGLDVVVLEQNERPGGCLWSTDWQGHRLEHGAVEHTAILTSGVVEELDLARHGLTYHERTVAGRHLFGDGTEIRIEETAAATAASIGGVSPHDAESWEELAELAAPMLQAVALASDGWIPPPWVASSFARLFAGRRGGRLVELTRRSVLDVADSWFESPYVRAMAVSRAVFSGLAPWTPGSAAAFLLTPAGHGRRFGRPVGGSRAVVDALRSALEAAGGVLRCGAGVTSARRVGSTWLVRTGAGDEIGARRAVVSAIAPRPFLLDVVDGDVPPKVQRRAHAMREVVDNLSQLTLAVAIDDDAGLPGDAGGMLWLLTEPAAATELYTAARVGAVARTPATVVTFPSLVDPTAAPPGRATMWANAFAARRLRGRTWSEATGEATEGVWRTIDACLPVVHGRAVHEVLTTPDDLTARNGADNAGSHVAPVPEQTLGGRPAPGLGNHRTPLPGLFLTGAGTHPGSGISAVSGRACAGAVLDALGDGRGRPRRIGLVAKQAVRAYRAARAVGRSRPTS